MRSDNRGGHLLEGCGGLHPVGDAGSASGVTDRGGTDAAKAVTTAATAR